MTPSEDQPLAVTLEPKDKGGAAAGKGGGKGRQGREGGKGGKGGKGGGKGTGGTNPIIEDPFRQGAGSADRGD